MIYSVRNAANQPQQQQTGAARPAAGRPSVQSVNNQNTGSGDVYINTGGDSEPAEELTLQVIARLLTYAVLSWFVVE